jgi:choline dehydrogenase
VKTVRAESRFWRLDQSICRTSTNADIVGGPDGHDWGYVGATGVGERSIRALRGKALGGSSAINAAVAIRARPADFAKWSALGIEGWSFDDVLSSYKAVENSPDGDDHYHGRHGPLPIRLQRPDELTFSQRFHRCGGESGIRARGGLQRS